MLKINLKKLIFFLALTVSPNAYALNFEGKFIQGHFIIGKTEPESKIWIDKKKVKVTDNGYFVFGIGRDRKYDIVISKELNKKKEAISKFKLALKISNNAEPMLALAIVLYSSDNKSIESLNLAKNALKSNPQYVSKNYQAEQLWGKKLQKSAQDLFKVQEMKKVVKEAKAKSQ